MYKEHSIITERYLKWVEVEVLLLNVTKKLILCESYVTPTFFKYCTFRWRIRFSYLTLFPHQAFKKILTEAIHIYPIGHAT